MPKKICELITPNWVEGELRLAGILDSRMIDLLRAIDQSGSLNQAAKQVGLSYKGAWQMIGRANNLSPKVLVSTTTGGSKGGGSCLTIAGHSLLLLFNKLELQHQQFLLDLNQALARDPDMQILLKRQVIKTSATNQFFGTISAIRTSDNNTEVFVTLKGGEQLVASIMLSDVELLKLCIGGDVLLLVNAPEIIVISAPYNATLSARNVLRGKVIRVLEGDVDSEIVIQLPSGESLVAKITQTSAATLGLTSGMLVHAAFKSNAVILGAISQSANRTTNDIKISTTFLTCKNKP